MPVENQIDPPTGASTPDMSDVEFRHMLRLGIPIRLREKPTGLWLLYAHDYNELHVADADERESGRVALLAALASINAAFWVSQPGFARD